MFFNPPPSGLIFEYWIYFFSTSLAERIPPPQSTKWIGGGGISAVLSRDFCELILVTISVLYFSARVMFDVDPLFFSVDRSPGRKRKPAGAAHRHSSGPYARILAFAHVGLNNITGREPKKHLCPRQIRTRKPVLVRMCSRILPASGATDSQYIACRYGRGFRSTCAQRVVHMVFRQPYARPVVLRQTAASGFDR